MINDIYMRTAALIGKESVEKLQNAYIAVFGAGGVGSAAIEALVRSGVGHIDIFDHDTISPSNLNRQLFTDSTNIGKSKALEAAKRGNNINPDAKISAYELFYLPSMADSVDLSKYDYIIDAVDTLTAKLELVCRAKEANVPIICSMGTGNKIDITRLQVSDISKTHNCPLARNMRRELRARGIENLTVVWSDEIPSSDSSTNEKKGNHPAPASAIFVPCAAGLLAAKTVVEELIK